MISDEINVKISKQRWNILAIECIVFFWTSFNVYMYFSVSETVDAYFGISHYEAEWLVISCSLAALVTALLLAWVSHKELVSLHRLLILASCVIILDSACAITAFEYSSLFGLLLFSQIISGVAVGLLFPLMNKVTEIWFPESQVGIAMGLIMVSASTGTLLANVLVPAVIQAPSNNSHLMNITSTFSTNCSSCYKAKNESSSWRSHDKSVFQAILSSKLFIGFFLVLYVLSFAPKKPEKSPSHSHHSKRLMENSLKILDQRTFSKKTLSLVSDLLFLFYSIASGIMHETMSLEILIMKPVIKQSFKNLLPISHEIKVGITIGCLCVGSIAGNLASGVALDNHKRYYIQAVVGSALFVIFTVGAFISLYFHFIVTFFLCYVLVGFFSRIGLIPSNDALMQHTYPRKVLFVSSCMTFIHKLYGIVVKRTGRLVFEHYSSIGIMSFLCGVKLIGFFLCVLNKPKTLRLSAESKHVNTRPHEETPLVSH